MLMLFTWTVTARRSFAVCGRGISTRMAIWQENVADRIEGQDLTFVCRFYRQPLAGLYGLASWMRHEQHER